MLPPFAELGNLATEENPAGSAAPMTDDFDDASFGIWSTIMSTEPADKSASDPTKDTFLRSPSPFMLTEAPEKVATPPLASSPSISKPMLPPHQRERLEEFATAFLGMSVFDAADLWMPEGESGDTLFHITSVASTDMNEPLRNFKAASAGVSIKLWSGAVGRAFASGNPVWSANPDVIVDNERASAFRRAGIQTALAVPIFSARAVRPICLLCCYSLVRTDAVPFVLRFVQQALRLLWGGLDRIEPHQSVHEHIWKEVAPADLGYMAADLEMQQEFLRKKRPHQQISEPVSVCS